MSTINFLRIALISKRAELYGYKIAAEEADTGFPIDPNRPEHFQISPVRPENPTIFMSVTGEWVAELRPVSELTSDQLLAASEGMRNAASMIDALSAME